MIGDFKTNMNSEKDKLPFTDTALAALETEVNSGKFLFANSNLFKLGIDTAKLEVENGVAGIIIPTYLKKISFSEQCDVDLGQIKMFPLTKDKMSKQLGDAFYIVFNCPTHIFNLIHEVRNLSIQIFVKRNTAGSYQNDMEMYRHDEARSDEISNKLIREADELTKVYGGKLLALQSLCAASSAIKLEVMEHIMTETAIANL